MKIAGLTYYFGEEELVLKCDSCLLNGKKPMFVPDHTQDLRCAEVVIARISRLGKHIEPKFADRYYDAVAPGIDFVAYDLLEQAHRAGKSWTEATGFDYSLAIGEWINKDEWLATSGEANGEQIRQAISHVSQRMTIRQGDLIYVTVDKTLSKVEKEDVLRKEINGEEKLYCKIK